MVQVIQQQDYGETLGRSLGSGLSKGLQLLAENKLKRMQSQDDRESKLKLIEKYGRARGLSPEQMQSLFSQPEEFLDVYIKESQGMPEVIDAVIDQGAEQFIPEGSGMPAEVQTKSDPLGFLQKLLNPVATIGRMGAEDVIKSGLPNELLAGLQRSAPGAITGQQNIKDPQNTGQEIAQQVGEIAGDLPLMVLGSSLGGPMVGLALPAFVKSASNEVWDKIRSDEKITPKTFGKSLHKVVDDTVKHAITGGVLGAVPGLSKVLQKNPLIKKMLSNQIAQEVTEKALQTGALAVTPPALEGRRPTLSDLNSAAALTFGFEALKIPKALGKSLAEHSQRVGKAPQELFEEVKVSIKEEGGDPSSKKDVIKALRNVTKEKPSLKTEKIGVEFEEKSQGKEQAKRKEALQEQQRYYERTPSIRKEVAGEKARLEERPERKGKEEIKAEAERQYPKAKKEYYDQRTALKEEKAKLRVAQKEKAPKEEIRKLNQNIGRLEANVERAKDDISKYQYERSKGRTYEKDSDLRTYAFNKSKNIKEDIKGKSVDAIVKENSLDAAFKEMEKKKTIPGQEALPEQTFTRIYNALQDAYKEQLKEVNSKLADFPSKKMDSLFKEKEVLEKLIKQNAERRAVHRRRQGLQDIGKTAARKEVLKFEREDRSGSKAAEKAQEVLKTKIEPELKKIVEEVKQAHEKASKKHADLPKGERQRAIKKDILPKIKKAYSLLGKVGMVPRKSNIGLYLLTGSTTWAAIGRSVADSYYASKIKGLKPGERAAYLRTLRKSGFSTARIKKILAKSKK